VAAAEQQPKVFKFKFELVDDPDAHLRGEPQDLEHDRVIPSEVKLEVWKRDKGRCVKCGSTDNLHFDHVLPFSKGVVADSRKHPTPLPPPQPPEIGSHRVAAPAT
jgi:hypothetical protein